MNPLNNKDEILNAAKKESYIGKEFENIAGTKSTLLASFVSLIVGTILFLVELFVKKTWNIGLIAVAMTASSVQLLYEGIKLKTVWKIIAGSIEALIALFFILGYIGQVIS